MEINHRSTEPHEELNPLERAAVLLIALESESPGITNSIFSYLGEEKSRLMLRTIASMGRVGAETVSTVMDEFFEIAIENKVVFGGKDVSSKIMKETFGADETDFYTERTNFFEYLNTVSIEDLLKFLDTENLQMMVLIFNYMDSDRMSNILPFLEIDKTRQVTQLLLEINIPNPGLIWELQNHIQERAFSGQAIGPESTEDSQINKIARVLEMVNPNVRNEVLNILEESNKKVLDKVKEQIFLFSDLIHIPDKDIQTILYEIQDIRMLAIAMRTASPELGTKFDNNMSDRVKIILNEELNSLPDEIDTNEIETAQRDILKIARKMEKEHKIVKLVIPSRDEAQPATAIRET